MTEADNNGGAGHSPGSGPRRAEASLERPADLRAGLPDDAVRRELAHLGTDASTAPEPPAEVTARVAAALRAEARTGTHTQAHPALPRRQLIALLLGGGAVAVAVAVGSSMLTGEREPVQPTSPTASQITAPGALQRSFPVPQPLVRQALAAPPDLQSLADPGRRASCLAGLGYSPTLDVLGGLPIDVFGRPAILLLLPGPGTGEVAAVVVEPTCSSADTGLLAQTVVPRP